MLLYIIYTYYSMCTELPNRICAMRWYTYECNLPRVRLVRNRAILIIPRTMLTANKQVILAIAMHPGFSSVCSVMDYPTVSSNHSLGKLVNMCVLEVFCPLYYWGWGSTLLNWRYFNCVLCCMHRWLMPRPHPRHLSCGHAAVHYHCEQPHALCNLYLDTCRQVGRGQFRQNH